MRILNTYIARDLLTTLLLAVGVWTFVMSAGHVIRIFDWVARGGSPAILGRFLLLRLPDILRFTLPLSLLCATVLVFSHLSADNEITAMKACGISLWQVIAPGLLLSVLLSAVCFWLSTTVAPRCRYAADLLLWQEAVTNPMVALEESGSFMEFDDLNIRIDRRIGDELYGIHILAQDATDHSLRQTITAKRGRLQTDPGSERVELVLEDATYGTLDLDGAAAAETRADGPGRFASRRIVLPLNMDSDGALRRLARRPKHMDLQMLFGRISLDAEAGADLTPLLAELHTRMSMALSPIGFFLLGIPFAVRGRRSETSVGLLLALLLALGFYAFVMLARTFKTEGYVRPDVLVWLPNIIYQLGGLWALAAVGRR